MAEIRYSSEGYDSTQVMFFLQDNEYVFSKEINILDCLTEIKIKELFDHHLIKKHDDYVIDENLINFFKDKPYNSETYLNEWTIMSFKNIMDRCDVYQKEGICVVDIGFRYIGMGHIKLIFYDPITQKYYFRSDGGSSGYERELNFAKLCKYKSEKKEELSFTFEELMQQINCEIEEKMTIF